MISTIKSDRSVQPATFSFQLSTNSIQLLFSVLGLLVSAVLTHAAPVRFDIPAQPAALALQAFIKQSGAQVMFLQDEARGVRANEVRGELEPAVALEQLLAGTGLVAKQTSDSNFAVARPVATKPGSIEGVVREEGSGKAVAGAKVQIAGTEIFALTDKRGRFTLEEVPAGAQVLEITAGGMQRTKVTDVTVRSGHRHTLSTIEVPALVAGVEQMEPYIVSAKKNDGVIEMDPFAVEGRRMEVVAGGNLDLPRSENDALPFTVFNREEIVRSGLTDLTTFLRREILETNAIGIPVSQDMSAGLYFAAPGSSNLDLRGFGFDETVILINGRRLPNVQVQNTRYPADVSAVPVAMIERVEVLPASASALYGDNAVGGVINIVLRPNIQATELTATWNNAFAFDAPQSAVSLVHGRNLLDGRLNLRLGVTHNRTVPVRENELGYYRAVQARTLAAATPALTANVFGPTTNIRSTDGTPLFGVGTSSVTSVAPGANGAGGLGAFTGRDGVRSFGVYDGPGGTGSATITGEGTILGADSPYDRPVEQTVYNAAALWRPKPWIEFSVDGSYSRSDSDHGARILRMTHIVPASVPTNPFGKSVTVSWHETLVDREDYNNTRFETSTVSAGLLVKAPGEWRISLDGQYGASGSRSYFVHAISTAPITDLVTRGILNPFRDTQIFAPPAEIYDAVSYNSGHTLRFSSAEAILRVTNQSLRLPTGIGSLVVGASYRVSDSENYESQYRLPDGTVTLTTSFLQNRTNKDWSGFVEFRAPLLPRQWLPRFVHGVEGDLGWRYADSDTFDRSPNPPTLGFKVDLAGGFSLRGSYTTGYKPPTPEMSVPVTEAVPTSVNVNDPRRGGERYTVLQDRSPNPTLVPEDSVTRTLGLVWQRGRTHRWRMAVDYNDTEKVNELSSQSASSFVLLESYFPERIERAAPTSGDPFGVGRVTRVRSGYINIAGTRAKSWSGQARYAWTECFGGMLDVSARFSWFDSFTTKVLPTSPVIENIENPDAPLFGYLKYRGSVGAGWTGRTWGFGADGRYYHALVLPRFLWTAQRSDRVDKYWEFDLHAHTDLTQWIPWKNDRYRLRGQLRLNNVFGADFPFNANNTTYGVQPYGDWRGRMYSVSITANF